MGRVLRFLVTAILLINFSYINCQTIKPTFKIGEKLNYDIYYNWGLIWIKAGEFTSSVSLKKLGNNQFYWFDLKGKSLKSHDWIYKFNDHIQGYADMESFKPYWAENNMFNDGSQYYENYTIDGSKGRIYSITKSDKFPLKKDTLKYTNSFFDIAGASYYLRSIDYSHIKPNEKITFSVISDNEFHPLYLRYLGKEQVILHNNSVYNCLKLKLLVIKGDVFDGGEAITVWITNDENHIPVQFEAKILVGAIKVYIVEAENASK